MIVLHGRWNLDIILFVLGSFVAVMDAFSSFDTYKGANTLPPTVRDIPAKLLIGYATNCDDNVVKAVREGVNVVIWSFMEIHTCDYAVNKAAETSIQWNSLDLECIRQTIDLLDSEGYDDTIHLVSFGGWNGPHLDPKLGAVEWFDVWKKATGGVFHGIDWDLEGHDDLQSPTNTFSIDCLEKMGCISRLAKEQGYIIGMAPPQSYLDHANTRFSRAVNLSVPSRPWHSEFQYFGSNAYAYVLAKYHEYIDFVSIQFYESYSRAGMDIYGPNKMKPERYLEAYVNELVSNDCTFVIDFEDDPFVKLSNQRVPLPLSKLVLGFANSWALETGDKALFIEPEAIRKAYDRLGKDGKAPRGFMFWVIGEEGKNGISFAPSLSDILQTRMDCTSQSQQDL